MLWVSWNLPRNEALSSAEVISKNNLATTFEKTSAEESANEATGHHPTVECKQTMGYKTHISWIVHCGLHTLEVTNLNVMASNLLRTCFKCQVENADFLDIADTTDFFLQLL